MASAAVFGRVGCTPTVIQQPERPLCGDSGLRWKPAEAIIDTAITGLSSDQSQVDGVLERNVLYSRRPAAGHVGEPALPTLQVQPVRDAKRSQSVGFQAPGGAGGVNVVAGRGQMRRMAPPL
jgi:hypothetical protein